MKKHTLLLLLLILLLGATLRLNGVREKGLLFWDEGLFVMGARFVNWRFDEVIDNVSRFGFRLTSLQSDTEHFEGYPVFLQKPGHVLLLAASMALIGDGASIAQALSAFLGTLCLLLVYLIGRETGDSRTGLMAAFILAIHPTHLHYSRVGLHEISSMVFLLGGVWFHLLSLRRSWRKGIDEILFFLSGAAFGFSIICSYRWIVFLPLIIVVDAFMILRSRQWRFLTVFWRFILFSSGFLIPLSLAEVAYFISFYPDYVHLEQTSYFSVLVYKFSTETHFDFNYPLHYVRQLVMMEGYPFLALVIIGAVMAVRRLNGRAVYCLLMFLIPFIMFSLNTTRVARAASVFAPWMALLTAMAVVSLHRVLKQHHRYAFIVSSLILVAVLPWFLIRDMEILSLRSGYNEAFEFLNAEVDGRHLSTMAPLGTVHFGRQQIPLHPPEHFEDLKNYCEYGKFRYVLVDWQKYVWYYPSIQELEQCCDPVITFENPYTTFPTVLNENYIPGYLEQLLETDDTISQIKIYDLNRIFGIPVMTETLMVDQRKKGLSSDEQG